MTWKLPVLNFKEIGSQLTEKSTKSMRYKFTKINVAQGIVVVVVVVVVVFYLLKCHPYT